jgi:succinate dehydrogenase/fumarate reductase flavoprotein subunit
MDLTKNSERRLSRRQFVRGSAVGSAAGLVVGAGGTSLLLDNKQKPWLPQRWDFETDVVVVGTGYAGSNAAIASHDAGAHVLVLEKAPERFAGGNSSVSGGGLRIPSNVPDAIEYYRALCFGTVPEELCIDLAEAMVKVPEQLKKLGIPVEPVRMFAGLPMGMASSKPASRPSERQARALNLLPGAASASIYAIVPEGEKAARMGTGHQLHLAHKQCVEDRGIQVMYETPVTELIQDPETKAILGVAAKRQEHRIFVKGKRAVVLACGGYEANYEMQGYFNYPGIKIYPWGTPYNTGDGIKMVSEIGAPLWHTFSIEWDGPCVKAPSEQYGVSIQTSILTVAGTPGSYILVNKYGRRFMDDVKSLTHTKESLELTHFDYERVEYPNIPFYMVFDETHRLRHPLVPPKTMCWNGIHKLVEWSKDNSEEIDKGWILKAESIRELATKTGIDAPALEKTVSSYNEYCRSGRDIEFGRRKETLFPVSTPPYYSAELALTCTNTQGGPKHNGKAQTLDKDNKPIPRLYTPGEFGSFFGFLYPGGSNIPEAIAFGRIAGKNAAAENPWAS